MQITTLASGSQGNATLVATDEGTFLVDAGLGADELELRLAAVGVVPKRLAGIVLTHRHKDHVRGTRDLALRHKLPIWCTKRTAKGLGTECRRRLRLLPPQGHMPLALRTTLRTLRLPHDAPDTIALVFESGGVRYGHVTDLGHVPDGLAALLAGCHGLWLEFNHDRALLLDGADPPHLKRRIAGREGHLDNDAAAALLADVVARRPASLRHLWIGHLSARNNREDLALGAARAALGDEAERVQLWIASQDVPGEPTSLCVPTDVGST